MTTELAGHAHGCSDCTVTCTTTPQRHRHITWIGRLTCTVKKPYKFFMASLLRTTGCLRIRCPCHTILLAARHKRAHPALTPATKAGTRFCLPQRDGRLSWPRCPKCPCRESNTRPFDRKSDAQTAAPSRHLFKRAITEMIQKRGLHHMRQRVNYKIATLVHRCLSGHVPSYLADDCRLVTDAGVRRLRSADTRTLVVGRTQSSFNDRTFAASAPRLSNSLPSDIRQPDLSYGQFRRSLKTFLGGRTTAQCNLW